MDAPGLPQKTLHALDDSSPRLMSNGIYVLYVGHPARISAAAVRDLSGARASDVSNCCFGN